MRFFYVPLLSLLFTAPVDAQGVSWVLGGEMCLCGGDYSLCACSDAGCTCPVCLDRSKLSQESIRQGWRDVGGGWYASPFDAGWECTMQGQWRYAGDPFATRMRFASVRASRGGS